MGHPRSDGALLKRSTSQVSSNDGPLLSRVAWETQWQKSPKDWVDFPKSLHKVMKTFHDIINKVPKLQKYAKKYSKLNQMPWKDIVREIADGVVRKDARLVSAENTISIEDLHGYVKKWRKTCQIVDRLIQWKLFGDDSAKKLAEFSRPGAYEQRFLYCRRKFAKTVTCAGACK